MIVIVIMVVAVIVIMVVVMIMQMIVEFLILLDQFRQRFAAGGLILHIGEAGNVVDDLLLEQRTAYLDDRRRVLLVELVDLALLSGKLPGAADQCPLDLLVAHDDARLLPDGSENEAEADAPLGNGAVFPTGVLFGGSFGLEALVAALHLAFE